MELGKLENRKYNYVSAICMVITIIFTITAFFKTTSHPPIYGIESFNYYDSETQKLEELRQKLETGKYTLLYFRDLNINVENLGDKHVVMLGKVKK